MLIAFLYPENYFTPNAPDEAFQVEHDIAVELGFPVAYFNQETFIPKSILPEFNYVYRGWMLSADEYKRLNNYVQNRFGVLRVSPESYNKSQFYSDAYPSLNALMPYTKSFLSDTPTTVIVNSVMQDSGFVSGSFFVKDSVKSVKNNPAASVAENVSSLTSTVDLFKTVQGEFLSDEILVKDFVELDKTVPEIRIWVNNFLTPVVHAYTLHPDFKDSDLVKPDEEFVITVLQAFLQDAGKNEFVTVDIAKTVSGDWVVIEVGNGQVSGVDSDDSAAIKKLYRSLTKSSIMDPFSKRYKY